MNIKKKKRKSLRFWVISLLAISAGAFSMSLVLNSCTTTSDDGTKIKVPSMSNTSQEVEVGKDASLFVNANCAGKTLNYQWYKATDENATEWQKIEGATSSTYKIPQTDITGGANSTLKYKVEVTSADNSVPKYTSPIFAVKVNNTGSTNTVTFTTNLPTTKTITAGDATTFTVAATTSISNATLTYDWYLDKGTGTASKVHTSTDGSYTIPSTDTSDVTSTQNWKLYVEAYPNSNTTTKATSQTCAITVNPKNSGGTDASTISFTTNLSVSDSMTAGNAKTFSVLAETKNVTNPNITYEWQIDKNNSGKYTTVQTSTNASYTIPAADTQNISSVATWKVQVKAYVADNSSISAISNTCTLTINPTGTTPTPPSPSPTPPTPSPSEPDNPSIINPPAHKPSEGIGARLPVDSSGITTVKYDQEKYVGDNSFSIAIVADLDVTKVSKLVEAYVDKYPSSNGGNFNANVMLGHMAGELKTISGGTTYEYTQMGTGWMLDYSNDATTSGLTNYYIATNMHVLSANFDISYTSSVTYPNNKISTVKAMARIPFNSSILSSLSVYISQPQYNTTDYKQNLNTFVDSYGTQWYKTNINKDNLGSTILPIGASNESNASTDNALKVSNEYDLEISWVDQTTTSSKGVFYFGASPDNQWLTTNNLTQYRNQVEASNLTKVDDFSVMKISLTKTELDNLIKTTNASYQGMFQKMYAMLNTTTDDKTAAKDSSYIAKLNALLTLTKNQSDVTTNKTKIDELFLFSDESKLSDNSTQLSYAGFPKQTVTTTSADGKKTSRDYATFNSNTMTVKGGNIFYYPQDTAYTRNNIGINQYAYNGRLYKINWKGPHNYLLKNSNLLAGSSGGMAIDQNYKVSSINWGTYNYKEKINGKDYLVLCSSVTALYSTNDKSSIIWRWVNYIANHDSNSKLAQLFKNLQAANYFTK